MPRILMLSGLACFVLACEEATEPAAGETVAAESAGETGEPAGEDAAAADEERPEEKAPPPLPERRFVEVKGDVQIDGNAAAVDMEIGPESTLETGEDGYAIITVEKGSTIEVRANSELTFGKSESAATSVKLAFGVLWSFMADGSSYEVVTSNAVVGVRGTTFFVQVPRSLEKKKAKKKKADRTYVCACSGNVHLQGANPKSFDVVVESPNEDHKAFDIIMRGPLQKKRKAKRKNHTDAQKMALMPYMEKTK